MGDDARLVSGVGRSQALDLFVEGSERTGLHYAVWSIARDAPISVQNWAAVTDL